MTKGINNQRIFWLGMHKILVQTELQRLRQLGYEVFNPPYLSSIQDQSANLDWDDKQFSTLPKEIFEKLAKYNFFYNSISPEIAEILNTYFDAIIVTISPVWLREIIKRYNGKIIYRVYGQHFLLSDELQHNNLLHAIVARDNFWLVAHAKEAISEEHTWLTDRSYIVPYCLTDDVVQLQDTWNTISPKWPKIALTCPNIKNHYFQEHYKFLQANFGESYNRYYGVQLNQINDPRVVGTIPREKLLYHFQKSSGYLYSYTEGRVCYLPPIEMMILGGPVLYLKGSLLDRFFNYHSPGRCITIDEARKKSKLLLQENKDFIDEVISSQHPVRSRYLPNDVWPIFDKTFQQILNSTNKASDWLVLNNTQSLSEFNRIYILHHFPGNPIVTKDGKYAAYDGIPRVVRQIVRALATYPNTEIVITGYDHQIANMNGYFRNDETMKRIRIMNINPHTFHSSEKLAYKKPIKYLWSFFKKTSISFAKKIIPPSQRFRVKAIVNKISFRINRIETYFKVIFQIELEHISKINKDKQCSAVLTPHYYWFPDALKLKKNMILYLPDYMPHFFHDTGEFISNEGIHTTIGKKLALKANKIFCNSNFTKSYLPHSRLKVHPEKIHVSYLPCLNSATKKNISVELDEKILEKPYIFYPTRPHPNKNLSFLLRVFDQLIDDGYDINLILTTSIESDSKAIKILQSLKCKKRVIFLDTVTDDTLTHLYKHAAVLCFTSLAEGNFPPQINEALQYETPIVAGRLEFITERIPADLMDSIIFCEPNNIEQFVTGCKLAINNRESILLKQRRLQEAIASDNVDASFCNKVLEIFNLG